MRGISLRSEVARIGELLGERVIFVGGVAVLAYLGWRYRYTHDIDIALISTSVEDLLELGFKYYGGDLYSLGGLKVDVYTRDVNGVPVSVLKEGAVKIKLGKTEILVPRVEDLIATKLTGRRSDERDIVELIRSRDVDWSYIRERHPNLLPELIRIAKRAGAGVWLDREFEME